MANGSGLTVVQDAQFSNDSIITTDWNLASLGCNGWKIPNHPLFQVANAFLFIGLMSPYVKNGVLALHAAFVFGFLLLTVWSWVILCAPDFFSWNFAFMIINIIQTLMLIYNLKPVKFDENLEKLYEAVFQPMNVSRHLFKMLTDKNFCVTSSLYEGDAYAMQGITKTDRLGLLISGTMKVYNNQNLLHLIQEMEFIDSPEFESSVTGDEKFQVSVYAGCMCQYIYWPRQSLEYVLLKEPFLATVLNTIMGRDITNKLYALNSRAKESPVPPSLTDPGSPTPIYQVHAQNVPGGRKMGDLRRTLAQLSSQPCLTPLQGTRPATLGGEFDNPCVEEETEDLSDGLYSACEEEVDLLSHEDKRHNQSGEAASHTSETSNQSGIHFSVNIGDHPQVHFCLHEKE